MRFSDVIQSSTTGRFDPEYFNREALRVAALLKGAPSLGSIVKRGYRVVYENTKVIDRSEGDQLCLPYFLQAADIETPYIHSESMACVSESDWNRYPMGHVRRGEVLIEVKGRAEKVAIVPNDFPERTLVTGTCYKLETRGKTDSPFLVAYLTSRPGQVLKNRLKTNLLVSFISKDELYALPLPPVGPEFKKRIAASFVRAQKLQSDSQLMLDEAQSALLEELGLANWTPPEPLTYQQRAKDVFAAGRCDSDYFAPRVQELIAKLSAQGTTVGTVAPLRKQYFKPEAGKPFNYIEISDVTSHGEAGSTQLDGADAPSRATWHVRKGDVITSTVRPIRGLTALIPPEQDAFVCSSGFAVLRPKTVPPELLLAYLRLPVICELMDLHTTASMYPSISVQNILALPFLKPTDKGAEKVVSCVQSARAARHRAAELLERAKRAVEIAIEDSEAAALKHLEGN